MSVKLGIFFKKKMTVQVSQFFSDLHVGEDVELVLQWRESPDNKMRRS